MRKSCALAALLIAAASSSATAQTVYCASTRSDGTSDTYRIHRGGGGNAPHIQWCWPPRQGQNLCLTALIDSDRPGRADQAGGSVRVLQGDMDIGDGPAPIIVYLSEDRFTVSYVHPRGAITGAGRCQPARR